MNHPNNQNRSSLSYRGKSSTENLSEDSGYCENITALRIKSKSIPNFLRHQENFLEDDNKYENHKSLEMISTKQQNHSKCNDEESDGDGGDGECLLLSRNENIDDTFCKKKIYSTTTKTRTILIKKINEKQREFKFRIDAKRTLVNDINENNEEKQHQHQYENQKEKHNECSEFICWYSVDVDDQVKNKIHLNRRNNIESSSSPIALGSMLSTPTSSSSSSSSSYQKISSNSKLYHSSSLPDVRNQFDHEFNVDNLSDPKSYDNYCDQYNSLSNGLNHKEKNNHFTIVSSLPNDLNIILSDSILNEHINRNSENIISNNSDFEWNLERTSAKSENRLFSTTSSNSASCYSSFNQSAKTIASSGQNYINASYNNLTLLDYSGRSRSNRNSFTMSESNGNSKRNSKESELGKGNFLLDELSVHFDRNLSILSDCTKNDSEFNSEFLKSEKNSESFENKPKPPARRSHSQKEQSKISNKKLIIEKPPRKHLPMKTFDQDPTVLKTNYTESLEKCNFDPKELSNTDLSDLTQIPNHSTPIKRGFVASTPNLNAYQRQASEIDDELHVSSAHTSMNPLPCEKKLGILLSDGSRTSLGKGVSFCPVVSEIRWREQSSEEQMDPDSLENVRREKTTQNINELNDLNKISTKNNNDEVDANITINTSQATINVNNIQNKNLAVECDHQQKQKNELKLTSKSDNMLNNSGSVEVMNIEKKITTISNVSIVKENTTTGNKIVNKKVDDKCCEDNNSREKIVNKKMLNCTRTEKNDVNDQKRVNDKEVKTVDKVIIKNTNVNNNNNVRMKSATIPISSSSTKGMIVDNKNISGGTNTGNDLLSSKFKPKPDEKHHKNGFLSRFAGGFRFSLRRKKKSSLSVPNDLNTNDNNAVVSNNKHKNKKSVADGAVKLSSNLNSSNNSNSFTSNNSPDFIYIPLKGPLPGRQSQDTKNRENSHLSAHGGNSSSGNDKNHVLLGKPPLPKQPPRVVGVCEKIRASPQQLSETLSNFNCNTGSSYRHAPGQRSSSQPKEIDERFLDSERQYYATDGINQLPEAMNQNGYSSPSSGTNILKSLPPLPPTKCPVVRPVGISIGSTVGPNGNAKIGLIETNLDTHETIISGKTRSLMELGPQVRHTLSKQSAGSDAGDTVIIDGVSRRPHKSMEFLLDKENQKNIMVSTFFLF